MRCFLLEKWSPHCLHWLRLCAFTWMLYWLSPNNFLLHKLHLYVLLGFKHMSSCLWNLKEIEFKNSLWQILQDFSFPGYDFKCSRKLFLSSYSSSHLGHFNDKTASSSLSPTSSSLWELHSTSPKLTFSFGEHNSWHGSFNNWSPLLSSCWVFVMLSWSPQSVCSSNSENFQSLHYPNYLLSLTME